MDYNGIYYTMKIYGKRIKKVTFESKIRFYPEVKVKILGLFPVWKAAKYEDVSYCESAELKDPVSYNSEKEALECIERIYGERSNSTEYIFIN